MANNKQAVKRIGINAKKNGNNVILKSELKTVVKKSKAAISSGAENSAELQREADKKLDKAAAKGIIHKKTASRKKSRIALAANKAAK